MGSLSRQLCVLIVFLSLFFFTAALDGDAAESSSKGKDELIFLTWSEYMDPALIEEFETEFGIRVKQIYFETDELRDDMIISSKGAGFDIVLGSGISLMPYLKRNWFHRLADSDIPNRQFIDPRWENARPELRAYAVPYLWGTLGIAYRRDKIKTPVNSWKQVFYPEEYLRGKIIMIRDSIDTLGPALKCLGYSVNSSDQRHYQEAETLLLAQKPFVVTYSYITLSDQSALVTGKGWMALVYNGDGLVMHERHPEIDFVVPSEGTSLWMDYLAIMRASNRKEKAMQFINFLHRPKNAARLSEYLKFATPNTEASKILSANHLNDPMIYPDQKILEVSEFQNELPPDILKRRNSIFSLLIQ
jgi:spermidine/putrescine transport system substrate-binding protein